VDKWLLLNPHGVYANWRVNYVLADWRLLDEAVVSNVSVSVRAFVSHPSHIQNAVQRAWLLNDAADLAR